MTTHVLIVDENTFKIHLEYMFIGTGAKEHYIDFNKKSISDTHYSTERMLVGMICDASRIRENDYIIFYVQQSQTRHNNSGPKEGKFYGVFQAAQDFCFLDNFGSKQFLKNELKKSLTFRTKIKPYCVYPIGITEWEALDNISNIVSPAQMVWSLIYRKLKGNRGNTPITLYESEKIIQLLAEKNNRKFLMSKYYSYDSNSEKIIEQNFYKEYLGRQEEISLFDRMYCKYNDKKSYEVFLQQYILQNVSKNSNLGKQIFENISKINWIGNEIGCGVGMQSIDILVDATNSIDKRTIIFPIELKASFDNGYPYIKSQFQRYIDWIIQYYKSNRPCDIQPILIIPKPSNINNSSFLEMINMINEFNVINKKNCLEMKIIFFEFSNNEVLFINHHYSLK